MMRYNSIYRSDLFQGQTIAVTGGGSGVGASNARQTWTLEESDRNKPYEGFHRSQMPEVLRRGPGGEK